MVLALTLSGSARADTLDNWAPGGYGNGGPVSEASITAQSMNSSGGFLYIADYAAKQIRIVSLVSSIFSDRIITKLSNTNDPPISVAGTPDGRVFFGTRGVIYEVGLTNEPIVRYTSAVFYPMGMTWHDGALYVANADSNRNQVLKFPLDSFHPEVVVNLSGSWNSTGDNGSALAATLKSPADVIFDGEDMYIAERDGGKIRRVRNGVITTFAGGGSALNDGQPATQARILYPTSIRLFNGEMYVADSGQHRIRKIDSNGIITTVAGTGNNLSPKFNTNPLLADIPSPESLTVDADGNVYIGMSTIKRIYVLRPSGELATRTSTPSASSSATATVTLTRTAVPTETSVITKTFTPSFTPTATKTHTHIPTWTLIPSVTPTDTEVPTYTPSYTPTETPSNTPIDTATASPTVTFTATATPVQLIMCDVTQNGKISSLDAAYVLQYVAGLRSFTDTEKRLADATGNGTVSTVDATTILQIAAGIIAIPNRCGTRIQ